MIAASSQDKSGQRLRVIGKGQVITGEIRPHISTREGPDSYGMAGFFFIISTIGGLLMYNDNLKL